MTDNDVGGVDELVSVYVVLKSDISLFTANGATTVSNGLIIRFRLALHYNVTLSLSNHLWLLNVFLSNCLQN